MKRFILALVLALSCMTAVTPAQARGGNFLFGFGLGTAVGATCCGWYNHYYSPYYGPAYAPYSYSYPVYYAAPPQQTVLYAQPAPAPVTYVAPAYTPAPQAVEASQASDVFVDKQGRTCRTFQSSINGAPVKGKACIHPDGTWHTVAG